MATIRFIFYNPVLAEVGRLVRSWAARLHGQLTSEVTIDIDDILLLIFYHAV